MGSRSMQKYEGSCHCGAVRFEIETDFPELTMCDCSICRRKNALMVKVHESKFRLLSGSGIAYRVPVSHEDCSSLLLQDVRHLSVPPQTRRARQSWRQRLLPARIRANRHPRASSCRRSNAMSAIHSAFGRCSASAAQLSR